ncbi:MAG: hypothetical protein PHC28_08480 [Flavobacterium sp.]|uniref:hypothetical protein n=1 Tax=Flavobacterium sp. TaxID=239 RepID=UPI0026189820|nr:hypothetical protein [Flavobacterium sp.]MDD5150503.1 hypothetical protein [Flavobacterium sp.]
MKKIIMLVFLFVWSANYAQSQVKTDSISKESKINIKADSNSLKGISVDTLDSFMVKKTPKPEITVVKNYLQPKSDSYFNMVVYVVKKQFQDSPIISWIFTVVIIFWFWRIIKRFFRK